jgi:hypothetical protein
MGGGRKKWLVTEVLINRICDRCALITAKKFGAFLGQRNRKETENKDCRMEGGRELETLGYTPTEQGRPKTNDKIHRGWSGCNRAVMPCQLRKVRFGVTLSLPLHVMTATIQCKMAR